MGIRILRLLNARSKQEVASNKEIVEIVSLLQEQNTSIAHDHKESVLESAKRHEEVIAAILMLKDGSSRSITPWQVSSETLNSGHGSSGSRPALKLRQRKPDDATSRELAPGLSIADSPSVRKRVLDCLWLRAIDERRQNVAAAHRKTFEWIFHDPVANGKPWSNFLQWLETGQRCYWINGKAGSGKSTLMKNICDEKRTCEALKLWAGDQESLMSSFFFWHAGLSLQRSQVGLMRSLLFSVLSKYQELIPVLLPGICRGMLRGHAEDLGEPTMTELQAAFRNLSIEARWMKICFFIDGIDEYDSDHNEIADVCVNLSNSTNIKFVLSSRPIPACVGAFKNCARLRLQDSYARRYKNIYRRQTWESSVDDESRRTRRCTCY